MSENYVGKFRFSATCRRFISVFDARKSFCRPAFAALVPAEGKSGKGVSPSPVP